MFGSHEAVKPDVLNHWDAANQNDDEHRFAISKVSDRLTSTSLIRNLVLIALKAGGLIGGDSMYWEVFDNLSRRLVCMHLNIADQNVIE